MNSCQVSFFDEIQRLAALSRLKDPLEELKKQIDFEKRVSRILPLFFLLPGEGARQAKGLNGGNQKMSICGPPLPATPAQSKSTAYGKRRSKMRLKVSNRTG